MSQSAMPFRETAKEMGMPPLSCKKKSLIEEAPNNAQQALNQTKKTNRNTKPKKFKNVLNVLQPEKP